MPDADLPPIELSDEFIQKARESIPALPDYLVSILLAPPHNLKLDMARRLATQPEELAFYSTVFESGCADGQSIFNWVARRLISLVKKEGLELPESPFTAQYLIDLLNLLRDNTINCIYLMGFS
jgi:aspartyl-tRNA(Asn)/glutamyl-tRNA(Gln) amidotransferase subunit B